MAEPTRRFGRFPRWALWLGGFALLIELAYVVGANLWLAGEAPRALAGRRPDRVKVSWERIWTPFPGLLIVDGLDLSVQTVAVQWRVVAAHASGWVALHELRERRFNSRYIAARGVEVRARRRAQEGPPTEREMLSPPFPEFEGVEPPAPRPRPDASGSGREPWIFHLPSLDLDDVRDVWVHEFHWTGSARARLDLFVQGGRKVRVEPSWVETSRSAPGSITLRPGLGLEGLQGRLEGRIAEFDPREERGWAILRRSRGVLSAEGTTPSGGVLDFYLRRSNPWLALASGSGPIRADLRLERGRWLPGSRVEGSAPDLSARFLDYVAKGEGRWTWTVEAPNASTGSTPTSPAQAARPVDPAGSARLDVVFNAYTVTRNGQSEPHVEGSGLVVESVAAAGPQGVEAFREFQPRRVHLPEATVPDLRVFNSYLPVASGVRLVAGSARLSGEIVEEPERGLVGGVRLKASSARVDALGHRLTGDFLLDAKVPKGDWPKKVFSLAGSRLSLENVRVADAVAARPGPGSRGWWARFDVAEGSMRPGQTPYFEARGTGRLRDSHPVVALAAERRPLPDWVQRVLEVSDVATAGSMALSSGEVRLRGVRATGEDIELRAEVRRRDGREPAGVFYARWRNLAVGLRIDGDERDYKVVRPLEWFEAQRIPGGPRR